jgi:CRISPR type III-A-associated protein Csm2
MEDEVQAEATTTTEAPAAPEASPVVEPAKEATAPKPNPTPEAKPAPEARPAQETRPQDRPKREDRPREERPKGDRPREAGGQPRGPRPEGRGGGGERRGDGGRDDRRPDRREGGPRPGGMGGGRPFENPEIEIEKLITDSLYLDNQAHAVVARMRDMDSGTKSQLRRLYNAVRRAVRAPESERQHQFVMLRARLAYTIARHSLRSLDALERLLLQVTRKNDARGYERFKDLFEAIVAYNE